jgi:hypothetical protein
MIEIAHGQRPKEARTRSAPGNPHHTTKHQTVTQSDNQNRMTRMEWPLTVVTIPVNFQREWMDLTTWPERYRTWPSPTVPTTNHHKEHDLNSWLKLKLKLIYDWRSVGRSVLVSGSNLEPMTRLRVSWRGPPSVTREWVCNLLVQLCNGCSSFIPRQLAGHGPMLWADWLDGRSLALALKLFCGRFPQ